MIYLTVNDAPSGVYKSQVVDVIKELNKHVDKPIKLVALISFRDFSNNKKKILDWYPNAVVKRMVPRLKNWKKNKSILSLIKGMKKEPILARGAMAFWLAYQINDNVSYDGRGAVKAELLEFPGMIPDKTVVNSIIEAEKEAVLKAYFRVAVSSKLISYWQNEFGYEAKDHIIIPCTLSDSNTEESIVQKEVNEVPHLVYAGSTAGWQSFEKIKNYIEFWIEKQSAKILFLSKPSDEIEALLNKYPDHVEQKWVAHEEVFANLAAADYGILIRDENTTNFVASPVKFAEYLKAGLKVLISPNLGDFSDLVVKEKLGIIVKNSQVYLDKITTEEKLRLSKFAKDTFSKSANSRLFKELAEKVTAKK